MGEVEKTRSTDGLQAKFLGGSVVHCTVDTGLQTENKRGIHSENPQFRRDAPRNQLLILTRLSKETSERSSHLQRDTKVARPLILR